VSAQPAQDENILQDLLKPAPTNEELVQVAEPAAGIDDARKAVEAAALASSAGGEEPIQALNAQPLGTDLNPVIPPAPPLPGNAPNPADIPLPSPNQAPSMDNFGLPPNLVPPNQPLPPEQTGTTQPPTPPPPVPPPMMPPSM
jgi:hypothetical protein